jgi:hypothetical protein
VRIGRGGGGIGGQALLAMDRSGGIGGRLECGDTRSERHGVAALVRYSGER